MSERPAGFWYVFVMDTRPNLVLVGFMGSGKSSVGRLAAADLGLRFVDLDHEIEQREGATITRIFETCGEEEFRRIESKVATEVAERRGQVIATGGGIVLRPVNLERLGVAGVIVHLHVTPECAWARARGHGHRPLVAGPDGEARLRELFAKRQPLYDAIPLSVEGSNRPPRAVAADVVRVYRRRVDAGGSGIRA
ncbi:MAG: shikimate kinase [Verrucomicrobiae bacterium]|nr:shikimate kinase [Verrucomicrobiae bacterium]